MIENMSPKSGRMLKEDDSVVNIADLLENISNGVTSEVRQQLQSAINALNDSVNAIETNLSNVEEMTEESIKTIEELSRYTRAFPFPPQKALISIRFDDNDASIYTNAYPIMKERGLVGSLAFVEDRIGMYNREKLTDAQTAELLQRGWELMNHSYRHGKDPYYPVTDTPTTYDEIYREVVQSKKNLEADFNQTIRSFVKPGNWNLDLCTEDSLYGKMIKQSHCFYQGYRTPLRLYRQHAGYLRWSRTHTTGDVGGAAPLIDRLNALAGKNATEKFMFHAVGEPGGGLSECISVAEFTAFCDRIKELIDLGQLECVTDSALIAATVGEEINHIANHDFKRGFANWVVVGNPTISDTITINNVNSVVTDYSNYCYYYLPNLGLLGSPKYLIRVKYKAVSGENVKAQIRVTDPMKDSGTAAARTYNLAATDDWQTFTTTSGATNSLESNNRILLVLRSSSNDTSVAFAEPQIIRIG